MRAVIVQHEEHEAEGLLGPALKEAGFTLVHRFRGVEREDLSAELVVLLGGMMGVNDGPQHPFLDEEVAFLIERLALERPCLGICLGAQLMARAAGSEVFSGKNGLEVGAAPVRWTAAGRTDEVTSGLGDKTVVAHWHQDTFSPVPGATLLASTDRYTQQAFRLGASYGFQFHPEVSSATLSEWLTQERAWLAERGKNVDELCAQLGKLRGAEPTLRELCARLAHHFAKVA